MEIDNVISYEDICNPKLIKMSNTLIEYPLFSFSKRERDKKREYVFEVDIRNKKHEIDVKDNDEPSFKTKQINQWCNDADIKVEKIVLETFGERIAAYKEFNLILALIEIWQDQLIENGTFNFTLASICNKMEIKNEYRNRQTIYNSLFNLQSFVFKIKTYYYKGSGKNKELIGSTANKIYSYKGNRFEMYDDLYESRKELPEEERDRINKEILKNISKQMILESNIIELPEFIKEDIQGNNNVYINVNILKRLKTPTLKKLYMILLKRGYGKSSYKISIKKIYDRIPIKRPRKSELIEFLDTIKKVGGIKNYEISNNDILTVSYYGIKDIEVLRKSHKLEQQLDSKEELISFLNRIFTAGELTEENIVYAYLVNCGVVKKVAKDVVSKYGTEVIIRTIYFYTNHKRIYIPNKIMGFDDELYPLNPKNLIYHIKSNNKDLNIDGLMMMDTMLKENIEEQPVIDILKDKDISEEKFEKVLKIHLNNAVRIKTIEWIKKSLKQKIKDNKKETI